MKPSKKSDHAERISTATDAKQALLQRFLAAQKSAAANQEARQAERASLAQARETRRAEREQAKLEEQASLITEAEERRAAAAADIEAQLSADKTRSAKVLADEVASKAERDRRYAERKARQK